MANKPAKMRMCIICRTAHPMEEMHRVARSPEGTVFLDEKGRADGRGAYICKNPACVEKAITQRRLERALSCRVDAEVYTQLGEIYA